MLRPLTDTRRLRVLMTADAVGGVWTYALDLAHGLARHGVQVRLALLGLAPSRAQRDEARRGAVDLVETGLPLDWLANAPDEVLAAGRAVAALARESKTDLVHLNSPALAAGGAFDRPVVAWCHSCVATWWSAVREGPLPPDLAWRADLVRRGYETADALAAPSAAFAAATAASYGLATVPHAVPNGRAALAPTTMDDAGASPPRDGRFVLCAGRLWDEGKNVAALDRMAARLRVPALAAGPLQGPNGTAVEVRHLRSLGSLAPASLARYLEAQPIFVSPARYEPFGLAVLEAAQAGCALVLSDIPTFRELWDGAAVFVAADDDRGLAGAVSGLLDEPERRAALGQSARARARRYTVDRMVLGTLAAYRSVVADRAEAA